MNTFKKRANTIDRRKLGSLCLLLFSVLLFLCNAGEVHAQDKYLINHIYTDYLGFWSSGVNEDVTIPSIDNPHFSIDPGAGGKFYLKSVEDRYKNQVEYTISPASRVQVNPCYVVSNPMMRSRARKL